MNLKSIIYIVATILLIMMSGVSAIDDPEAFPSPVQPDTPRPGDLPIRRPGQDDPPGFYVPPAPPVAQPSPPPSP
ncbi:uncharacterized protein LOC126833334 [Adelges cooleyi]|uniref:uncharacterized protein LOC126833334 n=1 Tax=Adelges cooleyi TaxID=133065 RepID=UPI00217F830A|nr:uncharacterized protein LOC126833334 [Adelges cooleyi]